MAQGVDDKGVDAGDGFYGSGRYLFGVGDVGEVTDAKSKYVEEVMTDREGDYLNTVDGEWPEGMYDMRMEHRGTGVGMLYKAVGHFVAQVVDVIALRVDVKSVGIAVGAQVVNTTYMVVMCVGDEQRIERRRADAKYLLAEVGASIDKYPVVTCGQQCRAAQTSVMRVGGAAYRAVATDGWYAGGGAGAEKCQFHISEYRIRVRL